MNQEIEESTSETIDKDARTWAMITHLVALAGFVLPFGNILGPLVIWSIKKDEHAFVNEQGKEAINFQLTMTIAFIVAFILVFVVIGIPLLVVLCIFTLIMIVVAAVKTNDGTHFRYPVTIRFFK
ncbi:MAG: DUF4870 domain-containing protein [Gammaproteobacteria bacterium]